MPQKARGGVLSFNHHHKTKRKKNVFLGLDDRSLLMYRVRCVMSRTGSVF